MALVDSNENAAVEKTSPAPDFVNRLVNEKKDLDKRVHDLTAFMGNAAAFSKTSQRQQELLGRQLGEMQKLQITLFERLEDLGYAYMAGN